MESHGAPLPGEPLSLWLATTTRPEYPPLAGNVEVDVAIIGGGLAGISVATALKAAGATVAVIEARYVGNGVTGNTTAKVTALHGLIYDQLIRRFGEEKARLYAAANQAGMREIRRNVSEHGIDCDLETVTAYSYTEDESEREKFQAEAEAGAKIGLPLEHVSQTPLPFPVAAAVRLGDQSQFHPLKYLLALAERIPGNGSHVFGGSRVLEYEPGTPCSVTTAAGKVSARDVVIASHYPIGDKALYSLRMTPERSYVLALKPAGELPEGLTDSVLKGTTPGHSMRTQPSPNGPLLLVGGEGHVTGEGGNTSERYRRLETWARERFGEHEVAYRWSAQDNSTLDGVPYIGRAAPGSEHLYVATGFGGWGMTHSAMSGMLITDLIAGRDNPWEELYDPKRVNVHGAGDFVKMAARSTQHLVIDRLTLEKGASVAPGEGVVVKRDEGAVALYRAPDGVLTSLSAACTHMGCIVAWNDAEKTWDCPCHGSRFEATGAVIQGPAIQPLGHLDDARDAPER